MSLHVRVYKIMIKNGATVVLVCRMSKYVLRKNVYYITRNIANLMYESFK